MQNKAWKIERANLLLAEVTAVTIGDRSENRHALSSVYQQVLSAENWLPKKPLSMRSQVPLNLVQKVDAGCGRCIHPARMAEIVDDAKRSLLIYKTRLTKWLGEAADIPETKPFKASDVHSLKPD